MAWHWKPTEPRLRPVSLIFVFIVKEGGGWKHDRIHAPSVTRIQSHARQFSFLVRYHRRVKKERLFLMKPLRFYSIFVFHRYPAKAEDMQLWPWKATETHLIAWAMVNAVTTCYLILAVAIRVTLTSNYACRSQCHAQHITATSDEVGRVLWETKTIITFISGSSLLSIPSR